mgnify:CR=1 FL=1
MSSLSRKIQGRFQRLIGSRAPAPTVQRDDPNALRRTSAQWAAQRVGSPVVLIDPDGWDRTDWTYSYFVERISEREYDRRLGASTIRVKM